MTKGHGNVFVPLAILLWLGAAPASADETQWFVVQKGKKQYYGPYSTGRIKLFLKNGLLRTTDFIWSKSTENWIKVSDAKEFNISRSPASDSPPVLLAQDESIKENDKSYVGGIIGGGVVTSSGGSNSIAYAGRIGTSIYSGSSGMFSLGLYVGSLGSASGTISGVSISGNVTAFASDLLSRNLFNSGLYLGGRFGLALNTLSASASGASVSGSTSTFVVGPVVGYDLPVMPHLNFGVDISWMSVSGGTITISSYSIPFNSSSAILTQGGLTYTW